ncbi:glycosyltransferase family 2 protein [Candidatus Uhrbacteria bacterium]|nr:glycosyltransferase family 2 protein [Candidatus Uhrbacteria bacterium]
MFDVVTVTVNFKMKDKILAMLRSLFRDIQGTNLKVQPVVVDNASGDGIEETLKKEFGDRVVFLDAGGNIGFGKGNNLGLKKFEAKYYFIANPDLVFLENLPAQAGQQRTLERLYQFMEEHQKVGMVAPRLQLPNGEIQPSCMRFPRFLDQPIHRLGLHKKYDWARKRVEHLHMKDFDHSKTAPIDWATGAALFVRGEWAKAVGFFDERYFMYFEDTDLCRTFWSRGWPVYYKGDVVIQHGHERASAKVPGLKSVLLNPLTRVHIKSLLQYAIKWRGQRV